MGKWPNELVLLQYCSFHLESSCEFETLSIEMLGNEPQEQTGLKWSCLYSIGCLNNIFHYEVVNTLIDLL